MIRRANLADLEALVQLETLAFDSDRLSRRSFRHLLTRGNAILLVDSAAHGLCGYALLRFRAGSEDARLYSLAVHHGYRRQGSGRTLLAAVEAAARAHGALRVILEVREDNRAAIKLYEDAGFRVFGRYLDFYADHHDALRLEKPLRRAPPDIVSTFSANPQGPL